MDPFCEEFVAKYGESRLDAATHFLKKYIRDTLERSIRGYLKGFGYACFVATPNPEQNEICTIICIF